MKPKKTPKLIHNVRLDAIEIINSIPEKELKPQVGRPKTAEPTTAIRVPDAILQDVKNLIAKHHAKKKWLVSTSTAQKS